MHLTRFPETDVVQIALREGAALVPVYSFGETQVYSQVNNPHGSRLRCVRSDDSTKLSGRR